MVDAAFNGVVVSLIPLPHLFLTHPSEAMPINGAQTPVDPSHSQPANVYSSQSFVVLDTGHKLQGKTEDAVVLGSTNGVFNFNCELFCSLAWALHRWCDARSHGSLITPRGYHVCCRTRHHVQPSAELRISVHHGLSDRHPDHAQQNVQEETSVRCRVRSPQSSIGNDNNGT